MSWPRAFDLMICCVAICLCIGYCQHRKSVVGVECVKVGNEWKDGECSRPFPFASPSAKAVAR